MILDLSYYGDPVLRKKAEPVMEITDEIRELVKNMIVTMNHWKGVGLAAPQVGVSLRIYVSNIDFEDDLGEVHFCEPKVYINPILTNRSEIMVEKSEACLSIPGLYAPVSRPLSVEVEALNLEGQKFTEKTTRYLARCMMHENDHLDGVLFIDRIKGKLRKEIELELKKFKRR